MTPLLTPREVAVALGVSYATVLRLVNGGAIPSVRVGRQVRVRREDLEDAVASGVLAS